MSDTLTSPPAGQTEPPPPAAAEIPQPSAKGRRGRPSKSRGAPKSSDDAQDRWTVRGVPLNVRSLAVVSASQRGLTVGDWVAEAVVAYAKTSPSDTAGNSAAGSSNVPATNALPDLVVLVKSLNERLTAIESDRHLGFWARLFGRRPIPPSTTLEPSPQDARTGRSEGSGVGEGTPKP